MADQGGRGGAIGFRRVTANISGSSFSRNMVESSHLYGLGGALYADSASYLRVVGCSFQWNQAVPHPALATRFSECGRGGAVAVDDSALTLVSSTFLLNTAYAGTYPDDAKGGAVFAANCDYLQVYVCLSY